MNDVIAIKRQKKKQLSKYKLDVMVAIKLPSPHEYIDLKKHLRNFPKIIGTFDYKIICLPDLKRYRRKYRS